MVVLIYIYIYIFESCDLDKQIEPNELNRTVHELYTSHTRTEKRLCQSRTEFRVEPILIKSSCAHENFTRLIFSPSYERILERLPTHCDYNTLEILGGYWPSRMSPH